MAGKKKQKSAGRPMEHLAWMGWDMMIPSGWRPLRIEGEWVKGTITVGDSEGPLLQVKWLRPESKRFKPDRLIASRTKKEKKNSIVPTPPSPVSPDFEHSSWLTGSNGNTRAVWYGYSPKADLMAEVVVRLKDGKTRKVIERRVIPSLRTSSIKEGLPISVFGSSFKAPCDFRLMDWKLQLGDITVRLGGENGECLMLRQVYPAQLALSRRPIERWLERMPFKEHRQYKMREEPRPCEIESGEIILKGVQRKGSKRLPVPLGFICPRTSISLAVRDEERDRLLIVEYDAKRSPSRELAIGAIKDMNWAMRNGNN